MAEEPMVSQAALETTKDTMSDLFIVVQPLLVKATALLERKDDNGNVVPAIPDDYQVCVRAGDLKALLTVFHPMGPAGAAPPPAGAVGASDEG